MFEVKKVKGERDEIELCTSLMTKNDPQTPKIVDAAELHRKRINTLDIVPGRIHPNIVQREDLHAQHNIRKQKSKLKKADTE